MTFILGCAGVFAAAFLTMLCVALIKAEKKLDEMVSIAEYRVQKLYQGE
jgi:hypothetical protein